MFFEKMERTLAQHAMILPEIATDLQPNLFLSVLTIGPVEVKGKKLRGRL